MTIKPDDLKNAILKELKEYDFNIKWDMSEASRKRTREGARMLRKNHGTKSEGSSGIYNTGWKVKKTSKGHVIHNSKRAGLTHLLEHGHFTVNKKSWVHEVPHISLVEKQVIANFEKDVERILKAHGR